MPGRWSGRDLVILCLLVGGLDDDRRFRGVRGPGSGVRSVGAVRRDGRECRRVLQERCLDVHLGLPGKKQRASLASGVSSGPLAHNPRVNRYRSRVYDYEIIRPGRAHSSRLGNSTARELQGDLLIAIMEQRTRYPNPVTF